MACPTTPAPSCSSGRWCTARSCGWRFPAARRGRSPVPTTARRARPRRSAPAPRPTLARPGPTAPAPSSPTTACACRCPSGKDKRVEIGIGLPNAVRGVDRRGVVEWAQRAEAAGFSTLGTIDRLVYPNYESLIALAAAAAVTERIRLATDILIAPLRANTVLLAKQAATIDNLSGGRLVLGLAVGGRADDFEVSGLEFGARGRTFDRQLEELRSVWSGERGVGPAPARDE